MQDNADSGPMCCCFCTTEFDTENMKDKHEVECRAGPRLVIKIAAAQIKSDVVEKIVDTHIQGSSRVPRRKNRIRTDKHAQPNTKHACDQCSYRTNNSYSFNRHKIMHQKGAKGTYSCNICDYRTWFNDRLKRHNETHIEIGPNLQRVYSCEICDFKTKRKCSLKVHSISHNKHKLQPYTCNDCGYQTYRKDVLRAHIMRHSKKIRITYKCTLCGKDFLATQSLEEHLLRKHANSAELVYGKVHRCHSCTYKSVSTTRLKIHMLSHSQPPYECMVCGHLEATKHTYRKHMTGHYDEVQDLKICPECGKECMWKYRLDEHIVRQHGDNEELLKTVHRIIKCCQVCNYKTTDNTCMARHQQSHSKL